MKPLFHAARALLFALTLTPFMQGGWAADPASVPVGPAAATPSSTSATPSTTIPAARALTRDDVETWLDGLMPAALESAQVPGAVVTVVKDGQILLTQGYGYADEEKRIKVDGRNTLFRPGSISKLFTWTAVMQQVEQGKLDLDADVNRYLDFQIPPRNGQAITLRHILTHTTGFEETAKDLLLYDVAPKSLSDYVKQRLPHRLFDAGTTAGYSNYATALAGYIVERVSGVSFDDYLDKHIFGPLGMNQSTFRQPLPPALQRLMSQGYERSGKKGKGYEIVIAAPAGSLASTGEDMGKFMIAHLESERPLGEGDTPRLLQPRTAVQMHNTVTRLFPDLNGVALGFYQQNINGRRVVGHGGDTNYFHSDMSLFMDEGVGLYISVNAAGKDRAGVYLRGTLFNQFADRYFPGPKLQGSVPQEMAVAHAKEMAGGYINTRRSDTTFVSLFNLLGPMTLRANDDGTLSLDFGGRKRRYEEVKPYLWQQIDGHDRIQATVVNGRIHRWSTNDLAFAFSFEKASGLAGTAAAAPLGGAALCLLALSFLSWPAIALIRRHYGLPPRRSGHERLAYRLTRGAAALGLAAVATWLTVFTMVEHVSGVQVDLVIHVAQLLSFLGFVGGFAASVWHAVLVFKTPGRGRFERGFAVVVALAFLVTLWLALNYHLIGVSAEY